MGNFFIAIGGSGAKLTQSLIHLGAAGLLPPDRLELDALLVDPDENNGNVDECKRVETAYQACKAIQLGRTDLFSAALTLEGPWSPIRHQQADALETIFHYHQLSTLDHVDADLMELLFDRNERAMSIKQGFRGRPAIGATVFAETVDFENGVWHALAQRVKARGAQGGVRVLLAGSVFGGSGASGVPTLVRLLRRGLERQVPDLRIGLALVLPYFQFQEVPGEKVQADPAAFPMATAEALKYYHERGFLDFCDSIFAMGEEAPAEARVSAVGAKEQCNEPHFIELVGGMGAMRFFSNLPCQDHSLAVAARESDGVLAWNDLPFADIFGQQQVRRLQKMSLFAVAYRYLFYPRLVKALHGYDKDPLWDDFIVKPRVNTTQAGQELLALDTYLSWHLHWLLHVSTPRRSGFAPGLVNPHAFGVTDGAQWRLRTSTEFNDANLTGLILNRPAKAATDARSVYNRAVRTKVNDPGAAGTGRLVRAIYDACEIQ